MNFSVLIIYDICILLINIYLKYNEINCIIGRAMKRRFHWYKNVKMAKICVYDSCICERRHCTTKTATTCNSIRGVNAELMILVLPKPTHIQYELQFITIQRKLLKG